MGPQTWKEQRRISTRKITIPKNLGNLRMSLSTHEFHVSPADPKLCCFHPTLLHVVRKTWKGRLTAKEPVPNLFYYRQDFDIIGQNVFIINKTSSEDEGRRNEALRMNKLGLSCAKLWLSCAR